MADLLDADVFIRARNLHYGFDFCPGFWDWLVEANARDRVFSIEKVGDELKAGDDELSERTNYRSDEFFLPPNPEVLVALGTVADWVTGQEYEPTTPPPPLPPIEKEDVELLCWMGIERE